MADRVQINVKLDEEEKQKWVDYVERVDTDPDTVSSLIRSTVSSRVDGNDVKHQNKSPDNRRVLQRLNEIAEDIESMKMKQERMNGRIVTKREHTNDILPAAVNQINKRTIQSTHLGLREALEIISSEGMERFVAEVEKLKEDDMSQIEIEDLDTYNE